MAGKNGSMNAPQKNECWIGFDLGGTKMMALVYDASFRSIVRKRRKTKGHEGAEAGLARIMQTIDDALAEANLDRSAVRGIGLGSAGPLDLDEGVILDAPNLGWKDVKIKAALEKEFSCPAVILNDVDAGVYGEYRFGAGKSSRCLVGVFPGTGIGGGCVYDGKILRGRTNSCMEIGHIQVMPDGPLCGCGLHGCLESVASRLAIASAAAQAAYRGQAPHLLEMPEPTSTISGVARSPTRLPPAIRSSKPSSARRPGTLARPSPRSSTCSPRIAWCWGAGWSKRCPA